MISHRKVKQKDENKVTSSHHAAALLRKPDGAPSPISSQIAEQHARINPYKHMDSPDTIEMSSESTRYNEMRSQQDRLLASRPYSSPRVGPRRS